MEYPLGSVEKGLIVIAIAIPLAIFGTFIANPPDVGKWFVGEGIAEMVVLASLLVAIARTEHKLDIG